MYLGRVAFIEQIEQLAGRTRPVHEVVLLDSKPNMLRRFGSGPWPRDPSMSRPTRSCEAWRGRARGDV